VSITGIPVVLGELQRVGAADDAGVVDQDVEPAAPLFDLPDDTRDRRQRGQIRTDGDRRASERRDPRGGIVHRRATHKRDIGARRSERHGDRLPEPGVRARHDGDASAEVERVRHRCGQRSSDMAIASMSA
jgi:hypothetical protein